VLDGEAWSNEPHREAEARTTTKPAKEAGTIARGRRDKPVRVGGYRVWYGVLCRTQDYGQGRHKQKTSGEVHKTAAAAR
jgi:hypothetical protein